MLEKQNKVLSLQKKAIKNVVAVVEEMKDTDCYDHISQSSSNRRRTLSKVTYTEKYGVSSINLKCMVTGKSLSSSDAPTDFMKCAHIIPRCATLKELVSLAFTFSDIDNIRNSLLLCKGIEEAFDRKRIFFVPADNPFSPNRYKLHIWDMNVKTVPIYEGAREFIGGYEGSPLILKVEEHSHDPFKRALSFQAFRACKRWIHCVEDIPVDSDSSLYEGTYKQMRADFAKQLARDIANEVEEDEDFLDGEGDETSLRSEHGAVQDADSD
eukprot:gene12210-13897_t